MIVGEFTTKHEEREDRQAVNVSERNPICRPRRGETHVDGPSQA